LKIKKEFEIAIIILLILLILCFEYLYLPIGFDWEHSFRPATLEFMTGHSPYTVPTFFMPPWLLIPLIPLVLLPVRISNLIIVDIGLLCYLFILYRLKIRPVLAMIFLLFPTTLLVLQSNNIDWLIILGFIFPPQIGLFLVLMKPQAGIAMAIYWLIVSPNKVKTFLPVTLAYLISFALYGFWILKAARMADKTGYHGAVDISFFPYLVPVGLALLITSIRKHKDGFAYIASPFLMPYVGANSYTVVILGIFKLWSEKHYERMQKGKSNEVDIEAEHDRYSIAH
jgi:hypothetical protein